MGEQPVKDNATAQNTAQSEASVVKGKRDVVTIGTGRGGILGVKAGMTQVYNSEGEAVPVTVIDLVPNVITQVKTKGKDGYQAVQVGLFNKSIEKLSSPEKNHLKAVGEGFKHLQEIRLSDADKMDGLVCGNVLSAGFLKEGDWVDLTAISKGKGFQGVVKRYHFGGANASHGTSVTHRMPGSIGNRADPGKVFKNRKMAGHMGHVRVTIQSVQVVKVDLENGVLLVNGSVPGPKSSIVQIQKAMKG